MLISLSLLLHVKWLEYLSLLKIIGKRSTRKYEDDFDQCPNNYVFLWYTQLFSWHVCIFFPLLYADIQEMSIPHFYYSSLHFFDSQRNVFNKYSIHWICIRKKWDSLKFFKSGYRFSLLRLIDFQWFFHHHHHHFGMMITMIAVYDHMNPHIKLNNFYFNWSQIHNSHDSFIFMSNGFQHSCMVFM